MAFSTVRTLADSFDNGNTWTSWIHKTGGPTSGVAGTWCDGSVGAGIPKYNAYVGTPAAANVLSNTGNDGIYLGPAPSAGQTKHLNALSLQSTSAGIAPAMFMLCDYLMFYPLIDGDSIDTQTLDNTEILTRYTNGLGVQCMAVVSVPVTSNGTVTVNYTNSDGVANRTSTFTLLASSNVGVITSSANTSAVAASKTPFIPLASGDNGIQSIQSVTNSTGMGGFYTLVLVKPITNLQLREKNTTIEKYNLLENGILPRIYNDAYLNYIYITNGTTTYTPLRGYLEFIWG